MDSSSNQHHQASSSTSEPQLPQQEVRSSARVKAAKEKAKDKPDDYSEQSSSALPPARSKSRRNQKSKAKEPTDSSTTATRPAKRYASVSVAYNTLSLYLLYFFPSARRNAPQPALTINEPVRDPKGKKRAAPEPNSDEEESAGPSTKRPRTTSYSLRSSTLKDSSDMPRKTR
jgi:E3 ubiquitin-protein ligase TRIP12